jgi:ubiquinone/menaquinone biosynthesis C-methylase UbiE
MPGDLPARLLETWERMAPGWEQERESFWEVSEHIGRELVDAVDLEPGETVLELAAGIGDTGFLATERIGPGGTLISSDFSPAMVDAARRRAAELGIEGVDFRVLDGQALDLPDASVDAVLCRWAYMLMPDPALALRETRRALRPGGRVALSVWGTPEENPWATIPGRVLIQAGRLEPPRTGSPGIFALADPAQLRQLVTAAGFEAARVWGVSMTWTFESFEDYWTFIIEAAGALSLVIAPLPQEEQDAIRAAVREALGARAEGPIALPGRCVNASARVPA